MKNNKNADKSSIKDKGGRYKTGIDDEEETHNEPVTYGKADELKRQVNDLRNSVQTLYDRTDKFIAAIKIRDENQKAKEDLKKAIDDIKQKADTIEQQNTKISHLNNTISQKDNEIGSLKQEKSILKKENEKLEQEFTNIEGDPKYPRLKDLEQLYDTVSGIAGKIDFYFKNMESDPDNRHFRYIQEIWLNTMPLKKIDNILWLIEGLKEAAEKTCTANPVIKKIIREVKISSGSFQEKITDYIKSEFINSPDFRAVFYNTERFYAADKVAPSPIPDKLETVRREIKSLHKQLEASVNAFGLSSPQGLSIFYNWQKDENKIKSYLHPQDSVFPDKKYPLATMKDDSVRILDIHNWGYLEKGKEGKLFGGMKFIEVTISKL